MKNKTVLSYLIIIVLLLAYAPTKTKFSESKKEVWLTFFVHGIMSIKPHINMGNFLRFMNDEVENTTYAKTVELMRQDTYFYKNQAMQGFGLVKIDPNLVGQGHASSALASLLNDVIALSHGTHIENHYYTYGWTGLMSPTRRFKDAIGLFEGIEREVAKLQSQGIQPKIRVIGYSHGGNVVLNLGAVRQQEPVRKDLVIDETILLGMPVQRETDYLIHDSVFKKIYHIYSHGDRVQKLDFFSYNRFFSSRIFKEREGFKLPKKLVQIQLKLTRNNRGVRKNKKRLHASRNLKNDAIVSGKSPLLRDSSPGHAELWFFGWTPVHYRQSFALNPLPAVSIVPYIIKTIDEIKDKLSPKHPVIVDMRPEHEMILIKNVTGNKFYKSVDFIDHDVLVKLQEKVKPYIPEGFSNEEYDKHIQTAFQNAKMHYQDQWSLKARRRNKTKKIQNQETSQDLIEEKA